jgi:hypothetical protein
MFRSIRPSSDMNLRNLKLSETHYKSRKFYKYRSTEVLRILFQHRLLKYIFVSHFSTSCFKFNVAITVKFTRSRILEYIFNVFQVVLNHVHSCLMMVV